MELMNVKEFMKYVKLGRNSALTLAKKSGARVKIGRRLLINKQIVDQWLVSNRG